MSMVLFQAILIMAWLDPVSVRCATVVLYARAECAEAMDQIAETRPRVAHLGCTALTPPSGYRTKCRKHSALIGSSRRTAAWLQSGICRRHGRPYMEI